MGRERINFKKAALLLLPCLYLSYILQRSDCETQAYIENGVAICHDEDNNLIFYSTNYDPVSITRDKNLFIAYVIISQKEVIISKYNGYGITTSTLDPTTGEETKLKHPNHF